MIGIALESHVHIYKYIKKENGWLILTCGEEQTKPEQIDL